MRPSAALQRHLTFLRGGSPHPPREKWRSWPGARRVRRPAAQSGAVGLVVAILLAGCQTPPVRKVEPVNLQGPAEVLAAHNAWADSIQHLWARADLRLVFTVGDGKVERHDLSGHLFLAKPDRLFVHGEVLGQEMFTLGTNAERYWLWIRPKVNTVWTGVRGGAGEWRLVVSPAALLEALGVSRISLGPGDRADFVTRPEHYVLSVERAGPAGRVLVRRVWFDPATLRPLRVDLFDDEGRPLLMAELMKYKRVGATDVCTVYRARFLGEEEVDLVLRLRDVNLEKEPNPRVFEYRVPPGATETDLDRPEDES